MKLTAEQAKAFGIQVQEPKIPSRLQEAFDQARRDREAGERQRLGQPGPTPAWAQPKGEDAEEPKGEDAEEPASEEPGEDRGPLEDEEQRLLAKALDAIPGLLWCHVPNGGHRLQGAAGALKAQGVKRGVPDVLIFTPPPGRPEAKGVALELKRACHRPKRPRQGARPWAPGCFGPEQRTWLEALERAGWVVLVAFGAADALRQVDALGYGRAHP